ncbi:methylmalonyl Co-A mutase-associated GTPase MeaB [candidate division KSB1 bacterium 4484_87]|nr:MAG: methylmalonyl Co-A mutase-associated GTPase MeaB [candidate division KSB1 bacterium 4484_87]
MNDVLEKYERGDRRALARLISLIENEDVRSREILEKIFPRIGRAHRIGVTGPPGAGKSTLVDQMTKKFCQQKKRVGIIAVDPTSPFSGGALLGDRIRMNDLATYPDVFIRSMATRGSLGGLANRAHEVADLLDGFGMDLIIFETVGVGQSELDIVEAADTTIVVLVPESGDAIQAMKAGLMEIGDIFVINKSDRDGADRTKVEVEYAVSLGGKNRQWQPPVVQTIASTAVGVEELLNKIELHRDFQIHNDISAQKKIKRLERIVRQRVAASLEQRFWKAEQEKLLREKLKQMVDGAISPYQVSDQLIEDFFK